MGEHGTKYKWHDRQSETRDLKKKGANACAGAVCSPAADTELRAGRLTQQVSPSPMMEGRVLDRQLLETEDGGEEPGRAGGHNTTPGTGCFSPLPSIFSCLSLLLETSTLSFIMRTSFLLKKRGISGIYLAGNSLLQQLLTAPAGLCQNDVSAWVAPAIFRFATDSRNQPFL